MLLGFFYGNVVVRKDRAAEMMLKKYKRSVKNPQGKGVQQVKNLL